MKYEGILAQPITARRLRVASKAAAALELERVTAEQMAKMRLLAKVHGVQEGDWLGLALALAITHVPGFALVSETNGDGEGWTELDRAQLRLEVDAVRESTGKSLEAAVQEVLRADGWRSRSRHLTASALRQHYYQAKPEWILYAETARRWLRTPSPPVDADSPEDDPP